MGLLPNGYKICNLVGGVYDTGIVSQSELEIDALFYYVNLTEGAFFGARNTNSATSAGQLYATTNYFGYRNARVSFGSQLAGHQGFVHLYVNDNYCEVNDNETIVSVSGSQGTFTGTRSMYINSYNNAGSQGTSSGAGIFGFIIKKDGVKLRDLVPCQRESDSVYGLYDIVEDMFFEPLTAWTPRDIGLVSIQNSEGGEAFIRTYHGELVTEILSASAGVHTSVFPSGYVPDIRAVAVPESGYEFEGWELNGRIVSKELQYDFGTDTDTVLIPHFKRITTIELNQGYRARVRSYGNIDGFWTDVQVISATISDSGLEKTTSRIACVSVPSTVRVGCALRLYTPKGKPIYSGMIEAIEDNTLLCREFMAFFDLDYLFRPNTMTLYSSGNNNVLYGIKYLFTWQYGGRRDFVNSDGLLSRKTQFITNDSNRFNYTRMSLYYNQISHVLFPSITETRTQNFEEFILAFASYGIFVEPKWENGIAHIEPYYYRNGDVLSFGDNMENISNVQIIEENQEGTIVQIYNSTGSTLRGMYGVLSDGTVARYDSGSVSEEDFIGYSNYVGEIVMSDDPVSTITADKLSSSFLNHKIVFDVEYNNLLTFDKLKVGTPVEFYIGNRMFRSVITAVNYVIQPNAEEIFNARITLGNVRTSLTSKLNSGRR